MSKVIDSKLWCLWEETNGSTYDERHRCSSGPRYGTKEALWITRLWWKGLTHGAVVSILSSTNRGLGVLLPRSLEHSIHTLSPMTICVLMTQTSVWGPDPYTQRHVRFSECLPDTLNLTGVKLNPLFSPLHLFLLFPSLATSTSPARDLGLPSPPLFSTPWATIIVSSMFSWKYLSDPFLSVFVSTLLA